MCKEKKNLVNLSISIKDTGLGIPDQDREKIFQSFEQQYNQNNAKYGGTGLGLAITKQLVELMNGRISLTSTPGKGSCFTVDFFNIKSGYSEINGHDQNIITDKNIKFSRVKVLIADNIESNQLLLKEILGKVNLEIVTAANGQEVLSLVKEVKPVLIIMDVRMPVISGFEAAAHLKADPETAHIPVIALTASATKRERDAALSQGFDAFLAKPIHFEALVAELSKHLECTAVNKNELKDTAKDDVLLTDNINRPEVLYKRLKQEVLPDIRSLKKAFVAGDFKKLGEKLDDLGKDHHVMQFRNYASGMTEMLNLFDAKRMSECLEEYSLNINALLDKLEK